jgi:hypothetical protein
MPPLNRILPGLLILLLLTGSLTFAQHRRGDSLSLYQDVYLRDTPKAWIFGNQALELVFSKSTGAWESLRLQPAPEPLMRATELSQTADFLIDTLRMVETHGAFFIRHAVEIEPDRQGVRLEMVYGILPSTERRDRFSYELTCAYTLQPGAKQLKRSARLYRRADADISDFPKMRGFVFGLPGLAAGAPEDCVVDVPGPFFPKTFLRPETPVPSLAGASIRFHSAPDAGLGLLTLSNRKAGISLGAWMETGGEVAYFPSLTSDGARVSFRFTNDRAYRMPANFSVASHEMHLEVGQALVDVLAAYRQMCERTMPLDTQTPAWVREMILLEIYPDYFPDGFKGITQRLPFYKDVGFNTIYLMPHWKGGYSPLDFYAVDPKYGTAAELKTLVRTAHSLGLKVFFDMVIHGFNEESPIPAQHPEIFAQDEGRILMRHPTWKSITTDWASPAYQQYMADLALHHAKTYGIDGYRLDAATYKGPSWDPVLPYPAYRSGSAAPELMQHMLDAMHSVKPEAVMLSEVFGPVFYTVSNLVHDNQTEGPQLVLEKMEQGEYTARDYKLHMRNVLLALPRGASRVYFARNHDTSWFYHFNGYTPRFLALDAIHALCAIPEVFAGDPRNEPSPDDDPAIYAYYKKIFSLRKTFPELARGELLLREIDSNNPMVFSALRRLNGRTVVVAVSLSEAEEEVSLTISPAISKTGGLPLKASLIDGLSRQAVAATPQGNTLSLRLKPFQVVVGRL